MKIALARMRPMRTVTWLAAQVGYKRNTVSIAIHQDRFPKVQAAVSRRLGL